MHIILCMFTLVCYKMNKVLLQHSRIVFCSPAYSAQIRHRRPPKQPLFSAYPHPWNRQSRSTRSSETYSTRVCIYSISSRYDTGTTIESAVVDVYVCVCMLSFRNCANFHFTTESVCARACGIDGFSGFRATDKRRDFRVAFLSTLARYSLVLLDEMTYVPR